VTAEAYCRKRPGKITEVSTTQVFTGPGGPAVFSPAATCGLGKAAIGGGFALTQPGFTAYSNFLTTNGPLGGVGWIARSLGSGGGTPSTTSTVYCQKLKKPLPQTSASVGMPAPSNGSAIAAVDTPGCRGKRTALAGGFEAPDFLAGQGIALMVESRRSGKGWHASTANFSGGPAGGRLTAFAICG
jgi:hypothetical protein